VFNVAAAGEYNTDTYLKTHFPVVTATLLCAFLFVVAVMLFNVLIALLTNASQKARRARPAARRGRTSIVRQSRRACHKRGLLLALARSVSARPVPRLIRLVTRERKAH
jgi:hypothetical protein